MKEYRVQVAELSASDKPFAPDIGDPATLTVREGEKPYVEVSDECGDVWGVLPRKGDLAKRIIAGDELWDAEFCGATFDEFDELIRLRVRVTLLEGGMVTPPTPETEDRDVYKVGLRGESNYQPAIRQLSVGDPIRLRHEPLNPYDSNAIAAFGPRGQHVGYIPRDSWLTRAMLEEEKSVTASVATIGAGGSGNLGVVLDVVLGPPALQDVDVMRLKTMIDALAPSAPREIVAARPTAGAAPKAQASAGAEIAFPTWGILLVIGILAFCIALIIIGAA